MRNVVKTLSVILVALVLVTGCCKEEAQVKEMFNVLKLQENASTGYKWEITVEDEKIAKIESNEYTEQTKEDIVGAPGVRTVKIAGVKEGTTTITFKYVGPGKKKPVAQTVKYNVTVNADNEVTLELAI